MRRHRSDQSANLPDDRCCSCIPWIEHPNGMHELLNSDGRMVDLSPVNEEIEDVGRPTLHLVDVDAGIEQQRLAADPFLVHEWKFVVRPAGQSFLRIKSRPPLSSVEVEIRHLRIRVSGRQEPCLWTP